MEAKNSPKSNNPTDEIRMDFIQSGADGMVGKGNLCVCISCKKKESGAA